MTKILVDLSAPTEGFGIAEFSVTEARSRLVMIQKFCKPSAPTDDFGIAEFSVTEARFGLIMIPKQLNIEKMREEKKKRKRKIGGLKYWYVYLCVLIEGLGNA